LITEVIGLNGKIVKHIPYGEIQEFIKSLGWYAAPFPTDYRSIDMLSDIFGNKLLCPTSSGYNVAYEYARWYLFQGNVYFKFEEDVVYFKLKF